MNSILSITVPERRLRRLVLGFATGSTLLLVAACGSDAQPSPDAERSSDSTPVASTTTDGQTTVASVDAGNDSTDGASSTAATNADADSATSDHPTAAEQYLADTNALLQAVDLTSDAVAAQLENADVESEVWRTETAATLRELAAVLDSAGDLTAPAEYATQHQQLVDATSKYSWATEMLADGVETLDLTTINNAAALLANASVELATAQAALTS